MASCREFETPPRPLCPEVQIVQDGSDLKFAYRPYNGGLLGVIAGTMLFVFLVISYVIFFGQDGPDEWHPVQMVLIFLLWIPFGVTLVGIMLLGFVGTEIVTIGQRGFRYERLVIVRLRGFSVPLSDIKEIRAAVTKSDDDLPRDIFFVQIEIAGLSPLRFAFDIEKKEQVWLVAQLNSQLEKVRLQVVDRIS